MNTDKQNRQNNKRLSMNGLLEYLTETAQLLLIDNNDFKTSIVTTLSLLSKVSGSDKTCIWSINPNMEEEDGTLYATRQFTCSSDPQNGNTSLIIDPEWANILQKGHCLNAMVCDMPASRQEQLHPCLSAMTAPIIFNRSLWGFISFVGIQSKRIYQYREEQILRAAGTLIGTAIKNRHVNQALSELAKQSNRANVAKSAFLANISHEIRTPINAIAGLIHITKNTDLNQHQTDCLEKMDYASKSLIRIINDLLDFSKIESGIFNMEVTEFKLETALKSILDLIMPRAYRKNLELLLSIQPNVPARVMGDATRLTQIITNLASNAIKYTENGEVEVSAAVEAESKDTIALHFTVRDTGAGMTESEMATLFTAFPPMGKIKHGSSSIGMTLCKKLVELMKGRIWCESKPGEGTTFHFTVTFGRVWHSEKPEHTYFPKGLDVMVIDDNLSSLGIISTLLYSFGCETVTMVESGRSALEIMSKTANSDLPDLIIIDNKMPHMDGRSTAQYMKELLAENTPPIIIMTSTYDQSELNEANAQGLFKSIMIKPITHSALYESIVSAFKKGNERRYGQFLLNNPKLAGAKLLLVEDNMLNQLVTKELLSQAGFVVRVANNGKDAVKMIEKEPFDLVLMDIQMPEMDGIAATKMIRADSKYKNLPIIAMTAHAMVGDREKSLEAGMSDHISKPVSPQLLFKCIEYWLSLTGK